MDERLKRCLELLDLTEPPPRTELPEDQALFVKVIGDLIDRKGEDWVKANRQLALDQWDSL